MKIMILAVSCLFMCIANATCQHAHRIISLAPNLTELVYTVGAQDSLIATDQSSDYPDTVKSLPKIANYRDLDIEKILSLHPDLVLAWSGGNPDHQVDQLKRFGIPVYSFKLNRLLDIPKALEQIGCLTGHEDLAQQKAKEFLAVYHAEKQRVKTRKPVTVFFELSGQPLLTLTKDSLVNDMITTCGGQNIFANTWGIAPEVSVESVIRAKPQVMIGVRPDWQKTWLQWSTIPAVQQKNMFTIDPDYIFRATYRSLIGLKTFCSYIDMTQTSR